MNMEETFVSFLRSGDTKLLLRQMRLTGWRVSIDFISVALH